MEADEDDTDTQDYRRERSLRRALRINSRREARAMSGEPSGPPELICLDCLSEPCHCPDPVESPE